MSETPSAYPDYLWLAHWRALQQYKKEYPSWIKAYVSDLDDEVFRALPDESKGLLSLLRLIASRYHGRIPMRDPEYLCKRMGIRSLAGLDALIHSGFLLLHPPVESVEKKSRKNQNNITNGILSEEKRREEKNGSAEADSNNNAEQGELEVDGICHTCQRARWETAWGAGPPERFIHSYCQCPVQVEAPAA